MEFDNFYSQNRAENKTCYIIGAAGIYKEFAPNRNDIVIAADGGYEWLSKNEARCDLLIGDFDSLGYEPEGVEIIRVPAEKDETDTFLAYLEGVKRGYKHFEIFGGMGGRDDHTFANVSLLLYSKRRGHSAVLFGDGVKALVIKNEAVELSGCEPGAALSVFAIGQAAGVDIKGAKYECEDAFLSDEFPLGVSNSFTGETVTVSVVKGELLIIMDDKAHVSFVEDSFDYTQIP